MRVLKSAIVLVLVCMLTVTLAASLCVTSGQIYKHRDQQNAPGAALIKAAASSAFSLNSVNPRHNFSELLAAMPALVNVNFRSIFACHQQVLSHHFLHNVVWFPWLTFGNVAIPTRAAPRPVAV